ncbi:MAG: ATP synthase F1 subunit delta [Candidatus Krumholzibacteria bacterium]|nr:ATP synthase F1 subunit delta [Candidatus Krumholzibacteria bacterium]
MIPRGIARRYATALFNAALKANVSDEIHEQTQHFRGLLRKDSACKNFLLSPQVLTEDKKDLITAIRSQTSELFVQFLLLLIDKKRFQHVEEIIDGYKHLYERHQGILEVKAITAVPLDQPMKQKTIDKLASETGKKIRLSPTVDPDIIGGMIVIMEDKIIDGSIRFRMEKLRRELDEIRV